MRIKGTVPYLVIAFLQERIDPLGKGLLLDLLSFSIELFDSGVFKVHGFVVAVQVP